MPIIYLLVPIVIYLIICLTNWAWIHNSLITGAPGTVLITLLLVEMAYLKLKGNYEDLFRNG